MVVHVYAEIAQLDYGLKADTPAQTSDEMVFEQAAAVVFLCESGVDYVLFQGGVGE